MTHVNRIGAPATPVVSRVPRHHVRRRPAPPSVEKSSYTDTHQSSAIMLGNGRALYCPTAGKTADERNGERTHCIEERMRYHADHIGRIRHLRTILERCDDPKIEADVVMPEIRRVYADMVGSGFIDDGKQLLRSAGLSGIAAAEMLSIMEGAHAGRLTLLKTRLESTQATSLAERHLLDLPADGRAVRASRSTDRPALTYLKDLPKHQPLMRHLLSLPK